MNPIILTCLLVGSWEFAGAVHAPQFGNAVNETMSVYLCLDAGGAPGPDGEPMKPSVGLEVRREIEMGDRKIQSAPQFICFVEGKRVEAIWLCPGLRQSWEISRAPTPLPWAGGLRP